MAERSAPPAVLARRWRSRPGVVRVAAVLLGLFGLLLVLVEADQGDLDAAELVTALVLVSAAAALVWAGRVGYWVGLTVAALVAVLLLVLLPDAHFDAYVKGFDAASGAARDWFLEHLSGRATT